LDELVPEAKMSYEALLGDPFSGFSVVKGVKIYKNTSKSENFLIKKEN